MASVLDLQPRRISVDEYHRMLDAGILTEEHRVELIEGVIVEVSPQKRAHAYCIQRLAEILFALLRPRYAVLVQLPLTLGSTSEPEPDLAILRVEDAASRDRHPGTALVVVEVSGDSLEKDRSVKAAVYARFGIPEYWVVNLRDESIEVHRDPEPALSRYRTLLTFGRGEQVRAISVPEALVRIDDIFG